MRKFEKDNHATLTFIKSGDTGAALNRAILTKSSPQADVFYGVDNTFLSRALAEDIFEPYASPKLAAIPAAFQLD
ncbi:MAG TPA: thiamine ABC transporter substrate-binding protein, partial [Anaerolinea sp.]|nr:thiamine ABC transporter substrate-binding protein [Anaerolinea sp.]